VLTGSPQPCPVRRMGIAAAMMMRARLSRAVRTAKAIHRGEGLIGTESGAVGTTRWRQGWALIRKAWEACECFRSMVLRGLRTRVCYIMFEDGRSIGG